ncbi:hypothetical protein GCM10010500_44780 [Streptomyces nigrescens]|nr:hypothetical protein GCM10010500_44780 [Streptomyces libani subsp. libani]
MLWQPHVHRPGLLAFAVGYLSVCLIAAGIGYGNGTALGRCLATTVLRPALGLLLIARRRSTYLRSLPCLGGTEPSTPPREHHTQQNDTRT